MDSEDRARGKNEARNDARRCSFPPEPGAREQPLAPTAGALLGLALALPCALWLWGFTVDDAFIPARVAAHLLQGLGPRFNPGGPVTDAVTPLGFAHWIALWAGLGAAEPTTLGVLAVARQTGFVVWLGTAALLGADVARAAGGRRRSLVLGGAALTSCVPLAAWAGSGLETPWVTLLCTWAALPRRGAPLAAGLAAAWRPELLPGAMVLILGRTALERRETGGSPPKLRGPGASERLAARGGRGWLRGDTGQWLGEGTGRWLGALAGCLGPALLVAVLRLAWFGRPTPLSLLAKAPDPDLGLRYCIGVLALAGPWWLLASRWTWRAALARPRPWGVLAAALGVHLAALVLAGGDWMPFFRLAVPVLPSVILLGVAVSVHGGTSRWAPWGWGLRALLMLAASLLLLLGRGEDGRRVMERRLELVAAGRPLLTGRMAATVDVGWVAAASGADVVDLAGVTDPRIAALPGGHTTKRVSGAMLVDRGVDTLVLLAERGQEAGAWPRARFRYGVDAGLAPAAFDLGFRLAGRVSLPGTEWEYLVCTLPDTSAQAVSR